MHRIRHGGDHTLTGSAQWALRQLSEFAESNEGYLFLYEAGHISCAARIGPSENEEVVSEWAREQLEEFGIEPDETQTRTDR